MTRRFRGHAYHIQIHYPQHASKRVKQMVVDRREAHENLVPLALSGMTHEVEAWLGE